MKPVILSILILTLIVPAEAGRKRRSVPKGKYRTLARATVREACPVCVQTACPDKVRVISQAEQEEIARKTAAAWRGAEEAAWAFNREFAKWMERQPAMSDGAAATLREAARQFYRKGATDGARRALKIEEEIR
ncbi:MAG: hypothetical protein ABI977_04945 [Acidobacteriota bacterium]